MAKEVSTSQYITKSGMSVAGEVKGKQGHQRLKSDNLNERDMGEVRALVFGQWKRKTLSTGQDSETGKNGV